jgi:hypothetical protein
MTKGKYKRKREHAQKKAEQGHADISLGQEERGDPLNTPNTNDGTKSTAKKNDPRWYVRLWEQIKKEPVTAVAITIFTCALTFASVFQGCVTRSQLTEMQKAQRPFVFASANSGNDWSKDSEHDMQITIGAHNASAFPAVGVVYSEPQVFMGTITKATEALKHCEVSYPEGHPALSVLAPATAGAESMQFINTVHTDYIYDKSRITEYLDQVLVYGGIKYSGISGGDFETRYCFGYLPKGNFRWGSCTCTSLK